MPHAVSFELIFHGRAGARQRHFADQHIPELRQFIETGLPEERADPGDARIFLYFENRLLSVLSVSANLSGNEPPNVFLVDTAVAIGAHGAELQQSEFLAVLAPTLLAEEYRALGSCLDQERDQSKQRRNEEQSESASGDIDGALDAQSQSPRSFPSHQIGIEGEVPGIGGISIFSFFREEMERHEDSRCLFRPQSLEETLAVLLGKLFPDLLGTRLPNLRADHSDETVFAIPADDVGLACDFVERLGGLRYGGGLLPVPDAFLHIHKHQDVAFLRALCPPSFHVQHVPTVILADDHARRGFLLLRGGHT